jgi:hypothetical protein
VSGGTFSSSGAGTCVVKASTAATTNFTAGSNTQNVTIARANQTTLTVAGPADITYGSTGIATASGGSGTGALSFNATGTGCSVSGVTVSVSNASGTCSLTATQAADANFNSTTSASFVVALHKANQATVTVTGPSSVVFGSTGIAAATGGSGGGTFGFSAAGTGCSVSGTTVSVSNGSGTCSLTAIRSGDNNYNASSTSAAFAVTLLKANQTIAFGAVAGKTYGDPDFSISASASSLLPVSLSSTTLSVCTLSGNTVHIVSAGACTIQGSQAGDANYMPAVNSLLITIAPACVTATAERMYIGTMFGWTSPTGNTASLTLSAGLKGCGGDIRTAKVTFATRNADNSLTPIPGASNLPVGLVNPGDITVGAATTIIQWNLGSAANTVIDVAIVVGGNFTSNSPSNDALVTIARPPGTNTILGAGSIQDGNPTNSQGYLKASSNDVAQYHLDITFNKTGTNPQGKVWVQINSYNKPDGTTDSMLHTYQFTSTAISTLAADNTKGTATFSSKATVQDITNPNAAPISVDGGATLQITLTDGDKGKILNPGAADSISIYVLKKSGGVWYANQLDSSLNAVQQPIVSSGGNDLIVK